MHFEAAARRLQSEHKRDVSLAWHVEAFARQKRLQPLKVILNPPKPLTPIEMAKRKAEYEELTERVLRKHRDGRKQTRNSQSTDRG
jgi:hypothetical protein